MFGPAFKAKTTIPAAACFQGGTRPATLEVQILSAVMATVHWLLTYSRDAPRFTSDHTGFEAFFDDVDELGTRTTVSDQDRIHWACRYAGAESEPWKCTISDLVEGVAIFIVVCGFQLSRHFCALIQFSKVIVGSLNDWQKERQFCILNDKKEERGVKVVRSGIERIIDVKDLLVGNVALLEPGEIIPCNGVLTFGHNVKCDESGTTG